MVFILLLLPGCQRDNFLEPVDHDLDGDTDHYRYTGPLDAVRAEPLSYELALPAEWEGKVEVLLNETRDTLVVVNTALFRVWAEEGGVEYADEEYSYTLKRDFPALTVYAVSKENEDQVQQYQFFLEEKTVWYAGEDETYLYYLQPGDVFFPDDMRKMSRSLLVDGHANSEGIGQERYDQLLSQVHCTPEEALEMFSMTP